MILLTANFPAAVTTFRASILDGEPVIFPTDTIYGIGAPIASIAANSKIFTFKNRVRTQPLPVLIANWTQFNELAQPLSRDMQCWLEECWAKDTPCTVVVKAKPTGTIALRMVKLGWLARAIAEVGAVTATSVNLSGTPPLNNVNKIIETFPNVKYLLCGEPKGGTASAIVDITGTEIKVLR